MNKRRSGRKELKNIGWYLRTACKHFSMVASITFSFEIYIYMRVFAQTSHILHFNHSKTSYLPLQRYQKEKKKKRKGALLALCYVIVELLDLWAMHAIALQTHGETNWRTYVFYFTFVPSTPSLLLLLAMVWSKSLDEIRLKLGQSAKHTIDKIYLKYVSSQKHSFANLTSVDVWE